jgi:hypothetical protein
MTSSFSKSNVFKYSIIIFSVLSISVIFLVFNLNNDNSQPLLPEKNDLPSNNQENPSWINELIKKEAANEVANPPASLIKCFYKDKLVYYFPASCCDIPSIVYDEKGNVLCSPDGGITGRGDGKCSDFFELKKDCIIIWENN